MLTIKQLLEIRGHLEAAQNPLFLFDNDVDGLCSAVILQRASGKGKSIAIKSFPGLNDTYLRRIDELNSDYIFILDKSEIEMEFLQGVTERGLPIVVIDHHPHDMSEEKMKLIHLYSTADNGSEPTTFIAHNVYERQVDEWVGMIGCTGDVYKPDFSSNFTKQYPELYNNRLEVFQTMYFTEIGKLVRMLNFGLKDTTTNVVKMIKLMVSASSPYDLLEENTKTHQLHQRYQKLNQTYQTQVDKGNANAGKDLVFLEYSGETSMSAEISNRLMFEHPKKLVIVAFRKTDAASVSFRGPRAKEVVDNVLLPKIPGAKGGGHEVACGARVPIEEMENFKREVKAYLGEE